MLGKPFPLHDAAYLYSFAFLRKRDLETLEELENQRRPAGSSGGGGAGSTSSSPCLPSSPPAESAAVAQTSNGPPWQHKNYAIGGVLLAGSAALALSSEAYVTVAEGLRLGALNGSWGWVATSAALVYLRLALVLQCSRLARVSPRVSRNSTAFPFPPSPFPPKKICKGVGRCSSGELGGAEALVLLFSILQGLRDALADLLARRQAAAGTASPAAVAAPAAASAAAPQGPSRQEVPPQELPPVVYSEEKLGTVQDPPPAAATSTSGQRRQTLWSRVVAAAVARGRPSTAAADPRAAELADIRRQHPFLEAIRPLRCVEGEHGADC